MDNCIRCKKDFINTKGNKTCSICINRIKENKKLQKEEYKEILNIDNYSQRILHEPNTLTLEEKELEIKLKYFDNKKLMVKQEKLDFVHPYSCKFIGARGSGKTTYLINYLNLGLDKIFERILWISNSKNQKLLNYLEIKSVEFIDVSLYNIEKLMEELKKLRKMLLIFDDCMQEECIRNNKSIMSIYTKGRHMNVSVISLEQHLYYSNNVERVNTDYYLLFGINDYEGLIRFHKKYCCELSYDIFLEMFEMCKSKNYPLMISFDGIKYRINFNKRLISDGYRIREELIIKELEKEEITKKKESKLFDCLFVILEILFR